MIGIPMERKIRVFQMRATDEWLQNLDEWRRQQPDLPTRAEAIRRLVETALAHARGTGR